MATRVPGDRLLWVALPPVCAAGLLVAAGLWKAGLVVGAVGFVVLVVAMAVIHHNRGRAFEDANHGRRQIRYHMLFGVFFAASLLLLGVFMIVVLLLEAAIG